MSKFKNQLMVCAAVLMLAACNKKEKAVAPTISNEALTTVQLVLINTASPFDKDTATWQQLLDVNGNPLPEDTSKAILNLHAGTTYTAQVLMYDKTQTPATNVSDEIKQRANYHLFFFQPTPISPSNYVISTTTTNIPGTVTSASGPYLNLTVNRTDYDTNNPPMQVGLTDNFVTGAASDGHLRVVMRHQPNVKNGTYDPGSSDADISFRVHIY
ncbi:MAG TPA: hypothetical protein VNW99_07220 [Cytophagaceae bacterium]|jgi:hypothetical protein|nr:hypothetical protein [Cytophagaceae bacterium]